VNLQQFLNIPPAWRPPLMVADGLGVDSTAMLLRLYQLGVRPDAVLHADTGDEHPETVAYREERKRWLASVGFPELVIVRRAPSKIGRRTRGSGESYTTLGQNCLANSTLPSLAFGKKACSLKWKVDPQNAWARRWARAARAWGRGQKVVKLIGYDAGPKDSRRAHEMKNDRRYYYVYPLRDWGWDRERCIAEIAAAGLPVPRKSACVYCPASKPHEIAALVRDYPALADYICLIEDKARPYLRGVEGLWREAVKGRRAGTIARPGAMADFIRALRIDPAMLDRYLVPPAVPVRRQLPLWAG
jgi:hypothetical protein